MNILFSLLTLFTLTAGFSETDLVSDHLGVWEYEVVAPDLTYKGTLEFSTEDGANIGTLKGEGITIPLSDINFEEGALSFKMMVQGVECITNASIEGDSLKGTVSAQGFSMPLTAKRK